jgi:hypothetical protein
MPKPTELAAKLTERPIDAPPRSATDTRPRKATSTRPSIMRPNWATAMGHASSRSSESSEREPSGHERAFFDERAGGGASTATLAAVSTGSRRWETSFQTTRRVA